LFLAGTVAFAAASKGRSAVRFEIESAESRRYRMNVSAAVSRTMKLRW